MTLLLTRLAGVLLLWSLEVALVRTLDPASWDAMSRFLTLTTLFAVAQLGLPESVLYFAARDPACASDGRLLARTSLLLALIGSLLSLPFHAVPALTLAVLGGHGARAIDPLSIFIIADLAFAPLPNFLLAQNRPRLASALSLGTRIAIACFVLAAVGAGMGLDGALWAMALGCVGSLLVAWLVVARFSTRSAQRHTVALSRQLAFSLPVGATRVVQIGNARLDKYVIMTVFAEAMYGTYYLGAAEFPIPSMICTAAMTVMMADLVAFAAGGELARLLELWHRSIAKIALVTLPLFALAMLFADHLMIVVYGSPHAAAALPFRIFQLLLLARVTNFSGISLALGEPRVPLVAAIIALGLNLVLGLILVRSVGLLGPALANVIAIGVSTLYTLWAIRRRIGVPWAQLFPLRSYLMTLAAAVVALVPAATVVRLGLPVWSTLGLGVTLYVAAYLSLCRAFKLISSEDREFLRRIVSLRFLRASAVAGGVT